MKSEPSLVTRDLQGPQNCLPHQDIPLSVSQLAGFKSLAKSIRPQGELPWYIKIKLKMLDYMETAHPGPPGCSFGI